jgi:hypothetical protein
MALSECLDCGYQVSTSAFKCPQCGRIDPASLSKSEYRRQFLLGDKDKSITDTIFGWLGGLGAREQPKPQVPSAATVEVPSLDACHTLFLSTQELAQGTVRTIVVDTEKFDVTIPAGLKPGAKLRMRGKGNSSQNSGVRGDLYLIIQIRD